MGCCKDKNAQKDKCKKSPNVSNDQLGENASEEYRSERYSNGTKGKTENK